MENMIELYFKDQFIYAYKNNLYAIKEKISTCTDFFRIDSDELKVFDVLKKQDDESYMNGQELSYIEDVIKIILPIREFWNDIKYYIPKTIIKLEVPFELLKDDISFLKRFPNLEALILNNGYSLSKEDVKKIYNNTNIKMIYGDNMWNCRDYYKEEGFCNEINAYIYK